MLTFQNPGLLDPRLIYTFGANVKTGPSPIGYFGTGLKYAIARILAGGGGISIQSGEARYEFSRQSSTIKGKTLDFIQMDTYELSSNTSPSSTQTLAFTTDLGKNWKPWMVYRELYSNALDEGGEVSQEAEPHYSDMTSIYVDWPELDLVYEEREKYFLDNAKLLWKSAEIEIHPARTDGAVFYRGIRVTTIPHKQSTYTYNILHRETLTEDRTLDLWTCSYRITQALTALDNQGLAEAILLSPSSTYESNLDWDTTGVSEFSPIMRDVLKQQQHNQRLNASARRRGRGLYSNDYLPRILPMSDEQREKVNSLPGLFQAFGLAYPWEKVYLGDMGEDQDPVFTSDRVLWLSPDALAQDNWLAQVLTQRFAGQKWEEFRAEKELLGLMHKLRPDLAILQPYAVGDSDMGFAGVEEAAEPALEAEGLPYDLLSGDQIPF